jgi:hypothetical protein
MANVNFDWPDDEGYENDRICSYPCEYCGEFDEEQLDEILEEEATELVGEEAGASSAE